MNTLIRHVAAVVFAVLAFAAQAADINRASQAELEALKGIGPALATRILEARASGPFKDWADVQNRVAGVKAAKATRLSKEGLTVAGAAFDGSAAASEKKARAPKAEATNKPMRSDKASAKAAS